jgi:voltage-gated potassium channel
MTVITLTTVGYKEVRELDTSGQLWTMALLITGVGTLFYVAVSAVEIAVEGAVGGYFERKRVRNKIDKLNEHYILGGDEAAWTARLPRSSPQTASLSS